MDVFMRNKAIYMDTRDVRKHSSEVSRNNTIDFLIYIRKNIDLACATKTMLAHTLLSNYPRNKIIKTAELFQFCSYYAVEFKRVCGSSLKEFEHFLRHFPLIFKVKNNTVCLRAIDMNELKRRYKTIIRRPKYLFDDGLLPKGLTSSFNVTLIETKAHGDTIAKQILDNHKRVAIDFEGYNLGLHGVITLCQVAVKPDHVYLFDILKCPHYLRRGYLREILESNNIQKVLHGIAGDAANLYRQFNITMVNVFDTQAAFKGLQNKYEELRMGYDGTVLDGSWKISLNELMALYKFDTNQIKGTVKSLYRNNPNLWSYRPLCPALLHYAGEDVNLLLQLQDAINNHPYFKPDFNETIFQTQKVILQSIKASVFLRPWVPPVCPMARNVVRGKAKSDDQKYTPWKRSHNRTINSNRFIVNQSALRRPRRYLNGLRMMPPSYSVGSDESSNADWLGSSNGATCPAQSSLSNIMYSCLFILTIGGFFIILLKILKMWRKKSPLKKNILNKE